MYNFYCSLKAVRLTPPEKLLMTRDLISWKSKAGLNIPTQCANGPLHEKGPFAYCVGIFKEQNP